MASALREGSPDHHDRLHPAALLRRATELLAQPRRLAADAYGQAGHLIAGAVDIVDPGDAHPIVVDRDLAMGSLRLEEVHPARPDRNVIAIVTIDLDVVDEVPAVALEAAKHARGPALSVCAVAPGQYLVVAPMFVTADDPAARAVVLEPGLPIQDMQPGGLVSGADVRAYATSEARVRLHQQRFKVDVMRAYRHRCAICSLRERALVQAAHIVPRRPADRPDPVRLGSRFERFERAAA